MTTEQLSERVGLMVTILMSCGTCAFLGFICGFGYALLERINQADKKENQR